MSNETTRKSISATIVEIEEAHRLLGLPCDRGDHEAAEIVARIERRMAANAPRQALNVEWDYRHAEGAEAAE